MKNSDKQTEARGPKRSFVLAILKITWLCVNFSLLLMGLWCFQPWFPVAERVKGESGIFVYVLMMTINFPTGWAVPYLFYPLNSVASAVGETTAFLLEWSGIFLAGYMQWFYAVPFLAKSVRKKFKSGSHERG